jgi:hypothetical protein
METQAAHAGLVPVTQNFRLDSRVGDGNAAQALRKALQRVEHDAIVVNMGVALHDEAVGKAEMVEERNEPLDRRIRRRVVAPRLVRKFAGRPENVEVRVPGARRRRHARPLRMRDRSGNARRLVRRVHALSPI